MNLESELKIALRRVEPPDGFASRVMARVGTASAGGVRPARTLHRAIAAALLLAITIGGWGVHETLQARKELITAMRIASQKVAHAQQQVNRR